MKAGRLDSPSLTVMSYGVMTFFALLCVFPFIYVISYSLTPFNDYIAHPMRIIPSRIDLGAYQQVLDIGLIYSGYRVTLFITVVGTAINVFVLLLSAYPLSKKGLKGRGFILLMIVITMYFNGGMIPRYYVVRSLGLLNSAWSLILPDAIIAFYLILMKSFIAAIPESLEESATIDGANEFTVLFRIILPLSTPAVATFVIYYAVGHWNDYFQAIMYNTKRALWPLMLVLREIVVQQEVAASGSTGSTADLTMLQRSNPFTMRMAAIVITTLPILVVYPFLQRFFMKGILLGSVKG
jgi:putative aldouronate transport system permease protein